MSGARRKAGPRIEVVTAARELNDVCERLRGEGTFAFDTEFIKEDTFEPQVCLVQLATEDRVTLVDPIADGLDLGPVWDLISDGRAEVIVHAGMEDMGLCHRYAGRPPPRVFDVQIAAGLVGSDYPLSLVRLVHETLGVRLPKLRTLSDWRRRPLSEPQKRYAVDDVAYLPGVHRILRGRLAEMGRDVWAVEEFSKFACAETFGPLPDNPLAGIRGAGSLDARAATIARELASERLELARRWNRPPRAVLRDHLLVEIARRGWSSPEEIRSLRGIQLSDRDVRHLADAVRRAQARPVEPSRTPGPPLEETPEEEAAIALVTAVIRALCLEHRVAYPLVCNRQDIRGVVLAHARKRTPPVVPALMRGWRHELLGPIVEKVLSGQAAVRLANLESGPVLRLE